MVDALGMPTVSPCPLNTYNQGMRRQRTCWPCPSGVKMHAGVCGLMRQCSGVDMCMQDMGERERVHAGHHRYASGSLRLPLCVAPAGYTTNGLTGRADISACGEHARRFCPFSRMCDLCPKTQAAYTSPVLRFGPNHTLNLRDAGHINTVSTVLGLTHSCADCLPAVVPAGSYMRFPTIVGMCLQGQWKSWVGPDDYCTPCETGVTTPAPGATSATYCTRRFCLDDLLGAAAPRLCAQQLQQQSSLHAQASTADAVGGWRMFCMQGPSPNTPHAPYIACCRSVARILRSCCQQRHHHICAPLLTKVVLPWRSAPRRFRSEQRGTARKRPNYPTMPERAVDS